MTEKRADLEDLQEAQEAEEEQAAAVTETEMTPMTTRPHQMPGNAEEETKYDPHGGHPASGEDNEPAIEHPEDEEDDDEEDTEEDDDMPDFMTESKLTPIVCHACTRKFAVNNVKLGLRCICGSNDLDLDDPTDYEDLAPAMQDLIWFMREEGLAREELNALMDEYGISLAKRHAGAIWEDDPDRWSYAYGVFDVTQSSPLSPAFSTEEQAQEWLIANDLPSTAWVDQFAVPVTGSKTALDVEAPDAEIPAPGGAVDDDPMPPVLEPTSSDEPRADELPDNQQFAEPFTDEKAVEAKMALMAREVFKSQNVSPKQALLIAQKVLAKYPLVKAAASRSIEIQISGGGPSTLARELVNDIMAIPSGDSWQFVINGQSTFTVWYDEEQAVGDMGGRTDDVTGEYEVLEGPLVGGSVILRQHVSPHGGTYGNPQAKRYAAEQVANKIADRAIGF